MAKHLPYWVSFGPNRMHYNSFRYAIRTAIVMANEYGEARIDWRYQQSGNGLWVDVSWVFYRIP